MWIDTPLHDSVPHEKLVEQFGDSDGGGIPRFLGYDYAVGDETCLAFNISLHRVGASRWLVETPVALSLRLPGHEVVVIKPGRERTVGNLAITSHIAR